ncbi:hypothetical protein GGS23DRAFT_554275, partial [Durotheca rogersii]|uniref:uncharacterized protein n=1 Tax=Durotheca rogersii TaxID=419775 RepID=UPI00221FF8F0
MMPDSWAHIANIRGWGLCVLYLALRSSVGRQYIAGSWRSEPGGADTLSSQRANNPFASCRNLFNVSSCQSPSRVLPLLPSPIRRLNVDGSCCCFAVAVRKRAIAPGAGPGWDAMPRDPVDKPPGAAPAAAVELLAGATSTSVNIAPSLGALAWLAPAVLGRARAASLPSSLSCLTRGMEFRRTCLVNETGHFGGVG